MPESERLGFAVSEIFGTPSAAPMLEELTSTSTSTPIPTG